MHSDNVGGTKLMMMQFCCWLLQTARKFHDEKLFEQGHLLPARRSYHRNTKRLTACYASAPIKLRIKKDNRYAFTFKIRAAGTKDSHPYNS
jgi:hypothetical protein